MTSHGDGLITENVDERLENYASIIHRRDNMILDFLTRPRSLAEILDLEVVYRRNQKAPEAFFHWDDRWMIEEHVKRLVRMGKMTKEGPRYARVEN